VREREEVQKVPWEVRQFGVRSEEFGVETNKKPGFESSLFPGGLSINNCPAIDRMKTWQADLLQQAAIQSLRVAGETVHENATFFLTR
jgi:hypothetical protein